MLAAPPAVDAIAPRPGPTLLGEPDIGPAMLEHEPSSVPEALEPAMPSAASHATEPGALMLEPTLATAGAAFVARGGEGWGPNFPVGGVMPTTTGAEKASRPSATIQAALGNCAASVALASFACWAAQAAGV
jgi:hypothetical protein